MANNIFPTPPVVLTVDQQTAALIDRNITTPATVQLAAYNAIVRAIYANNNYRNSDKTFNSAAALAAFAANTSLSMTGDELLALLSVIKGGVNFAQAGTIGSDAITAATITLP